MRVSLLFLWILCFSFDLLANTRLDRVRSFHDATVQQYTKELIQTATKKVEFALFDRTEAVKKLHTFSGSLLTSLDMISIEDQIPTYSNYKESLAKLIEFEKHIQEAEKKVSLAHDAWLIVSEKMRNEKEELGSISATEFCAKQLDASSLLITPIAYPKFDEIDLAHIPKPQFKGVSPVPGRSDDSSDVSVESGFMLASTTAGSAIGASIGAPIPVFGWLLGAVIGAGVGAIVGYCSGKGAVATKVAIENKNLQDAYANACSQEEAKQRRDIEETQSWLSKHPITEDTIRRESSSFCASGYWLVAVKTPLSQLTTLQEQVNNQIMGLGDVISEKADEINSKKELLRQTRKLLETRVIADLTTGIVSPLLTNLDRIQQEQHVLDIHEKVESTLFRCTADPQSTCSEKELCLDTAKLDVKERIAALFLGGSPSEKLSKFQFKDWTDRVAIYEKAIANCVKR